VRWIPILVLFPALHAGTLYYTDFESFTVGPNNWADTDGWLSNDNTSGAQAIEFDLFPTIALGNSATLGFVQPTSTFVSVYRVIGYDHTATGLSGIEINSLVGIEDSTNSRRDDFFVSIYNAAGTHLASIRFDNADPDALGSQFGIWREDGVLQFDTLTDFIPGQLFDLYIEIDLSANTWSADIEGFPLFTDAPFTANATGADINFGVLAYEWDLTAAFPVGFGNNYLAIDELTVRSYPIGVDPFTVTGSRDSGTGHVTLTWHGDFGFDYQVEYSTNLETWHDTLPGSSFPGVTTPGPMTYTDTTPTGPDVYYRVVRSESP
jgi:hypothetical protein